MKKYQVALIGVAIVAVIIAVILAEFTHYIADNWERLVFEYMLYDHIQYNGNDYYMSEDQGYYPSKTGENQGPVYLVNKRSKVIAKTTYEAYVYTGYDGEDEEIYLFFDSAMYTRDDYLLTTDSPIN